MIQTTRTRFELAYKLFKEGIKRCWRCANPVVGEWADQTFLAMDHKILLIDDSAILRRIAANVLNVRAGYGDVVTATRATEGFARACASGARLILVDYQIAGIPKADLCRRLLDEPRTSRVPVILLLGPGMTPPPREALPANIVDHLVKPFTPEQLLAAVRNVFKDVVTEVPVRRIPEIAAALTPQPAEMAAEAHAVAVTMSTTASTQRETNRFLDSHQVSRRAGPAPAAPLRERTPVGRPADPARLREALAAAADRRETGVFRVRLGEHAPTEVYLDGGQIVVVATRDAWSYGEDADGVLPAKVSTATLEDAVAEQARTGTPFFLALGSCGLLSKSAAVALLHRFGQRHFARLWSAPPGAFTFEFEALDALPGFALRLEPRPEPVNEWMFEASRHIAPEDLAGVARHEGFGGLPWTHGNASAADRLPLNGQERDFVRFVDGRRSLATVAANLDVTVEHAFLLAYRFRCLGIMDYRPAGSAFVVTPRTSVRRVLPLQR